MLIVKKLRLKGFRAYTQEKRFSFDDPMVLLFGENHRGKSSTLNAIEWCLFGNECIGGRSGIRERIDWEILNRNMGSDPEVFVDLELEDEKRETYRISRQWISKTKDELKVSFPGGQLQGKDAEEKLAHLLMSSFRDFLTTVYQHQEAIHAILTQEPRERDDAIDRLLGLSDYRNILSGIESAKIPTVQRKIGDDFDGFQGQIEIALRTRENDLSDMRKEASTRGLKEDQLTSGEALSIAAAVKRQLQEFALQAGLSVPELRVPERWEDVQEFQEVINKEISKFRSEMPDVKKQQELFERRAVFARLRAECDCRKQKLRNAGEELERFVEQNGNEVSLNGVKSETEKQIFEKEKELSKIDAKAAAISRAMEYLRIEGIDRDVCPVCGKETADLLKHLEEEWEGKCGEQVEKVQKQINELRTRSKNIESLLNRYEELEEKIETVKKEIKDLNANIGKILEREVAEGDDTFVLLGERLYKIEEELKKLEQAVKSKQEALDRISILLEQIHLIVQILGLEQKKEVVEQIRQLPEYKQMEELRNQMAVLVHEVDNIKQAIGATSYEEAQEKVSSAKEMIDRYFHKITNNPAVGEINFLVSVDSKTGRNSYEFKDQNRKDLTPVLSQGDLNALALSIFLGMASLKGASQPFGFIMLDDPSQSLGSEHKQKLVAVLDEVLVNRIVVLASADKELQDLIVTKITKAKTRYDFDDWTLEKGPEVRKE
jgi:DNA repair exonuclease SbcCD ATPase subunit